MRKPYIAGNWKMNLRPDEGRSVAFEIISEIAKSEPICRVAIAPSFVDIPYVVDAVKDSPVTVLSQNIADHVSGAYTGEVSASMLKGAGVYGTIIGHSERRQYYGETDEIINGKVLLALKEGMEIILCVGETLEEREAGKLEEVLSRQIVGALKGVVESDMGRITIAYEPVWAIGTGRTATPNDADSAHSFIRKKVGELYSSSVSDNLIIQYGGSVKPDNVKDLMGMENIDGALVGGASLNSKDFLSIIYFDK